MPLPPKELRRKQTSYSSHPKVNIFCQENEHRSNNYGYSNQENDNWRLNLNGRSFQKNRRKKSIEFYLLSSHKFHIQN